MIDSTRPRAVDAPVRRRAVQVAAPLDALPRPRSRDALFAPLDARVPGLLRDDVRGPVSVSRGDRSETRGREIADQCA